MDADLRILSAGAVKTGVDSIVQEFERTHGVQVAVEFETTPRLRERIGGGEAADVIVAPPEVMDEFQNLGKIVAASRTFVGRSRMGVVVHSGDDVDVSSTAAFKRSLLAAKLVVLNKASSGVYAAKLLERLGVKEALGERVIVVNTGAAVMRAIEQHGAGAIGFAQVSEVMVMIAKGCAVRLAGPLPDDVQNVTSYEAAASAASRLPQAAHALARRLGSEEARKIFAATGISQ